MELHRLGISSANLRRAGLAAGPCLFLGLFFIWPVAQLLVRGLGNNSDAVIDVFRSSTLRSAAWFTLWQAVVSTLLTLLVALPLTAVVGNVSFRGRRLVLALVTIPFVLPTIVVAGALLATSDRIGLDSGPFSLSKSVFAILVAHVFFNVAVVVRTVGSYWSQLSRDAEHAARTLGTSPVASFFRITLRRLRAPILAATSIVFLFTFTSFAVVLILGGARQRTIETEIYRYAISRTDFTTAATLSVVQLIAVVALVAVNTRLRSRLPRSEHFTTDRLRPWRNASTRIVPIATVVATLTLLAIPILVLVEQSLRTGDGWGFAHYSSLSERPPFLTVSPLRAVANSVGFALVAASIAVVFGGWASVAITYSRPSVARLIDVGYLLPLGTSAVTLGFGILITFDSGLFDLRQSWIIIPLTQSLIGIPFVTRAVVPVLRSIDPHLREAAASMGASPRQVRRDIDFPIARRALTVGAGFAFAISLGEFGATSFVGRRPDLMTVPLAIGRLLSQPGQNIRGQAMALSVILMVVTAAVLLAVDRTDSSATI
ncbi:MAG: iron ABC transporter permease [Acidimicrobiia bacterium]|nr:iron ABC transporter permease [Acidimicrobiia bacterium]